MSRPQLDAVVVGGKVVLPEHDQPFAADVSIADGRVLALNEPGTAGPARVVHDARGGYVFPGGVDPHVHVSWPFLSSRTADDYATATRAAAAGGTTTIVDFAIEGRESPAEALARRRAQAEGEAVIDFSFHCVISDASEHVLEEMAQVVAEGVTSFKLYMTYRRRGLMVDDATLFAVAERAAELGAAVGVHAENGWLEEARLAPMQASARGSSRYFPELKPPFVEAEAVARASRIVAAAGARLWVLHLSSGDGLRAALGVRRETGQPAALETCPQYLLLDESLLLRPDGHRFLCSPPLRARADAEVLWEAVASGTVDWIGTDHCLFLANQKDVHADAFWECPHGLPGIQPRLALMLHAAVARGVPLNRCAALLAGNAARFLGLYPRKGTLLPGSDADLAVWDMGSSSTLANSELSMGSDWTPYEGLAALRWPSLVLVRGEPVAKEGRAVAPAGFGRFVARPYRPAPAVVA